ncbi:hypothetical protein FG002_002275 [Chitinimonas sp. BJB300]|nr:hypothetical protein FG002_002275 [Chitinimonas sp. BJB300]
MLGIFPKHIQFDAVGNKAMHMPKKQAADLERKNHHQYGKSQQAVKYSDIQISIIINQQSFKYRPKNPIYHIQ